MIGRREEYEKMFQVEEQLWWYRILHEHVLTHIQKRFGARRDIRILDAGCGTGGLMHFLRRHGYLFLQGVDGSEDAVAFCRERGLFVEQVNLNHLATYFPVDTKPSFDVIICNDVFCYFDDTALRQLLHELGSLLTPEGILITNNNAFHVFKGAHDLAVGSTRRFTERDFLRLLPATGLAIQFSTYWSLLLSPLILLARQLQNLQLRFGKSSAEPPSDVYLPQEWINTLLYQVVRIERRFLTRTPFGSSLFMVLVRK